MRAPTAPVSRTSMKASGASFAAVPTSLPSFLMPAAGVVRDHLVQALAQGYGEEDWSVIARVITNGLKAPQR